MGEYALYNGERIKIGTCESLYYLRADQAHLVKPVKGSINPLEDLDAIRFRFPFPNEDDIAPGCFSDAFKSQGIYGVPVPVGVEHNRVQFTSTRGYLASLVCPEVSLKDGCKHIARNGNPGPVRIVQQRFWQGKLVLVCECGGCGAAYRLETLADAQPVIDHCIEQSLDTRLGESNQLYWGQIAGRIKAGYTDSLPWKVTENQLKAFAQ